MGQEQRRIIIFALDAVLLLVFLIAAWSGVSALILLGVLLVTVILWFKGFVRFPRVTRLLRTMGQGIMQLVRTHRMNRRQTVTYLSVLLALIVLVVVNQLRLALPGKGHGISIPVGAFSFNFTGVNAEGDGVANIISYGLLLAAVGVTWYRLWQGVRPLNVDWRRPAYLVCLVAFILMPFIFTLLMATLAPPLSSSPDQAVVEASSQANAAFSALWLGVTQSVMALAICVAIALPLVGEPAPPVPAPVRAPMPAAPVIPVVGPPPVAPPIVYQPYGAVRRQR